MKQNPKISVIIPFYNVEKYIDNCIKSVLNQTIKDIEIIFVNDASTDNSLEIVEKYAKKDNRIKLISLEKRQGQGYARNRALEIAKGEYIGFVDSDDFVNIEMFQKLYELASKNDNDITMCLAQEYDEETGKYIDSDYYSLSLLKELKDKTFSANEVKDFVLNINVAIWNKLYKHSFLKENKAFFPEGYIYEDLPFFFSTFIPAKKIQILWEHFYYYRINRKSSTMNQYGNKILDRVPMVSLTYEKLKKSHFYSDIKKDVQGWIINDIFHRYTLLNTGYQKEYFFQMKKLFESLGIENIKDKYWKKIYHFEGYKLVLKNSFEDFNQVIFHKYVDVHEIEDRIKSYTEGKIVDSENIVDEKLNTVYEEITKVYQYSDKNKEEFYENFKKYATEVVKTTDDKFTLVYEDIKKNYTYTENIVTECEKRIDSRLNTEFSDNFSNVYDEITKNYKYTENLVSECENRIKEHLYTDFENKISNVYNDISKNYEYTENLVSECENRINENLYTDFENKISNVYNDISKNYEYTENLVSECENRINTDFENKISNVYNDISKNYEYTENLISECENKINGRLDTDFSDRISSIYNDISKNYEYTENLVSECENKINSRLDTDFADRISNIYNDISKNYEYTENLVKETESKINQKFEEELQDKISTINNDLSKNHEYTKNLVSRLDENIKTVIQETKLNQQIETDEKIFKVYNTISKNQQQIEDSISEYKNNADEKIQNIQNTINETTSLTNEKLTNFEKKNQEIEQSVDNFKQTIIDKTTQIQNEVEKTHHVLKNDVKNNTETFIRLYEKLDENIKKQNDTFENKFKNIYDELVNHKNEAEEKYSNINEKIFDVQNKIEKEKLQLAEKIEDVERDNKKEHQSIYEKIFEHKADIEGKLNWEKDNLLKLINSNRQEIDTTIKEGTEQTHSIIYDVEHKLYETINSTASDLYTNIINEAETRMMQKETALYSYISSIQKEKDIETKELFSNTNNDLSNLYKICTSNNEEIRNDMTNRVKREDRRYEEIQYILNSLRKEINDKISAYEIENSNKKMAEEINYIKESLNQEITNTKTNYETKLEEQKVEYEYKIINLEEEIAKLKIELSNKNKNFLVRFFDKNKKK